MIHMNNWGEGVAAASSLKGTDGLYLGGRRMKFMLLLLAFGIFVLCPSAYAAGDLRADLVAYGIFQVDGGSATESAIGSADQVHGIGLEKLTLQTETIPLKKGLEFGVQYRMVGGKHGHAHKVTIRGKHPAMAVPGIKKAQKSFQYEGQRNTDEVVYEGYRLEHDYELVPGRWTIQVWHNKSMLLEQTFLLVKE